MGERKFGYRYTARKIRNNRNQYGAGRLIELKKELRKKTAEFENCGGELKSDHQDISNILDGLR